jgi:hypothetical protein
VNDEATMNELRSWERKAVAGLLALLTTAFLAWAGVVWSSADKVMARIDRMADQLAADRLEQQMYRAALERRITIIEERQGAVLRRLERDDGHIEGDR